MEDEATYIMYLINLIISKTKDVNHVQANYYKDIISKIVFNDEDPLTMILDVINNRRDEKAFLTLLRLSSEFVETDHSISMRCYFILQSILLDVKDRLDDYE